VGTEYLDVLMHPRTEREIEETVRIAEIAEIRVGSSANRKGV